MLLNADQNAIRDAAHAFAQEQRGRQVARGDTEHHFPQDAHQGLAQLSAYSLYVPEQLDGAGQGYMTLALVLP